MTASRVAWLGYAVIAAAFAALGFVHWVWSVTLRGPVMYGEGAVANAAILARARLEYTAGGQWGDVAPIFTAANYPPLFLHLASIGDPFVTGRILSIASTLFVAGAIAYRARPAGGIAAGAIALAWLGSVPVLQWGSALKPDLLALALTVAAVMALDVTAITSPATPGAATSRRASSRRYLIAGALLGLAAMAKPTALLPAVAMLVFVSRQDRRGAMLGLAAGIVAALACAFATHGPEGGALTHVIEWNELAWRVDLAASLVFLGLVLFVVPLATIALTRPSTTVVTAYTAGAAGIVLLGGREGATINYLLDLSAALALALAGRAPLLASAPRYPIAGAVQLIVALLVLNPFGVIPGRATTTGAWGDPERIATVAAMNGPMLVEDSGLLVASGRQPAVDDVFLWSRLHDRQVSGGLVFEPGDDLLAAVRAGRFDAVVTEADLSTLDATGGFERQRWHRDLVSAILGRYSLQPSPDRRPGSVFVYTRR